MTSYRRNHYVPEWFQKRFLTCDQKEKKFHYLDLTPEKVRIPKSPKNPSGGSYTRKALLRWGPDSCFYQDDLYTTKLGSWQSTEIEEKFFGKIDSSGQNAVDYFHDFTHPSADGGAFNALLSYMSIQKLRTPKGLTHLQKALQTKDKNHTLFEMQRLRNLYCALWSECVWSIVDASNSNTKFILSDHPVTVYNQGCYPESKKCKTDGDPDIWQSGTYTIFPLGLEKALILTNLNWLRNPYGNPQNNRPNPDPFRQAMFKFTDIQTGRLLTDEEVIKINYIIKSRAKRYIAAPVKEWLFPEKKLSKTHWPSFGTEYLLMPDPREVPFTSGIVMGFKDGSSDASDEYGRKPWHRDYKDKQRHEKEWLSAQAFKSEFARKFGRAKRGMAYNHINEPEYSEEYHERMLKEEAKYKDKLKKISKIKTPEPKKQKSPKKASKLKSSKRSGPAGCYRPEKEI